MKRKPVLAKPSRKAPKKRLIRVKKNVKKGGARVKATSPRRVTKSKRILKIRKPVAAAKPLAAIRPQKPIVGARAPWHAMVAFFGFAFMMIGVSALLIKTVSAATYQPPTQAAPGGNIPVTIWNRASSAAIQTNAAIDIDGNGGAAFKGVAIGSAALVIAGGQNLLYGNIDTTSTGNLILLQNEGVEKFRVSARGDVKGAGCFGATFVGFTPLRYQGTSVNQVTSYYSADNRCSTAFSGSHVCRPEEILESISCSLPGDAFRTVADAPVKWAWLSGGPPGFTASANDCAGWSSNSGFELGKIWIFNQASGGTGSQTTCNTPTGLQFACCR